MMARKLSTICKQNEFTEHESKLISTSIRKFSLNNNICVRRQNQ
uniref:Uncharacterized protein n=1 Tax=Arundo donax TaxID=35708 RepID=A0A0A9C6B3_ARUDO